jgi:hypothetical protein
LIIRIGKFTKKPESYSYEKQLKFLNFYFWGFESIINKDKKVDDPNKTAEVVPMYLSPSVTNSITCINTIATAVATINPKNKYFVSYLIAKADSIFFVLLN